MIDDPAEIERLCTTPLANGRNASINNFDFGDLTVDDAGEYALFCVLHPAMTATVTDE